MGRASDDRREAERQADLDSLYEMEHQLADAWQQYEATYGESRPGPED